MQSAERNRYLNEIRKALRPRRDKNVIMGRIMEDMEEYLAVNPEASIEELRIVFGTPEDYTKEYVAGMDRNQFYTTVSARWRGSQICLAIAAILLVFSLLTANYISSAIRGTGSTYIVDIDGVVIEEGTLPSVDWLTPIRNIVT